MFNSIYQPFARCLQRVVLARYRPNESPRCFFEEQPLYIRRSRFELP